MKIGSRVQLGKSQFHGVWQDCVYHSARDAALNSKQSVFVILLI
jgi:hypothetical protein